MSAPPILNFILLFFLVDSLVSYKGRKSDVVIPDTACSE